MGTTALAAAVALGCLAVGTNEVRALPGSAFFEIGPDGPVTVSLPAGTLSGAEPSRATSGRHPSAPSLHSGIRPPLSAGSREQSAPEPGANLSVSLITVGQGDQIWEMFGHNAIRIRDRLSGADVSYNWGLFSFSQEGFLWRFLLGDWRYWMDGLSTQPMVAAYAASGRRVVEQQLDLAPAERLELLALVERNRLPEHRYYRYQYFLDNCSTRARDVLDQVLDGRLNARYGELAGATFRFHTRRLTAADPLIHTAIDFFMSGRGDRPITRWDEMFIPMLTRDMLRDAGVVASETVVAEAEGRSTLAAPPPRFLRFALAGAVLAALLAGSAALASAPSGTPRSGLGRLAKASFLVVAGGWSLVVGIAGLVMITSHFTSHEFMHWNENFLQANPLSLLLGAALVPALLAGKGQRFTTRLAWLTAAAAAAGFCMQILPGVDQVNGNYLAVGLPAHFALAWGLRRLWSMTTRQKAAVG